MVAATALAFFKHVLRIHGAKDLGGLCCCDVLLLTACPLSSNHSPKKKNNNWSFPLPAVITRAVQKEGYIHRAKFSFISFAYLLCLKCYDTGHGIISILA
ncbi:hypothetical protein AOQ84DRAFT_65024 [Glonium stellatum]|uniref:Uncharacterized protein n=1 Tax=Glonium stellatum TaxID=574774 RepID=A0A8E2EYB0_9PEZI|nr:hypothetical protein AOQ84DRAFT_65024 [Glonium stellatum]